MTLSELVLYKSVTYHKRRKHHSYISIYKDLKAQYKKMAPELITVYSWCQQIDKKTFSILPRPKTGRPPISGLEEKVKKPLKSSPYSSTRQIAKNCLHAPKTVKKCLVEKLGMVHRALRKVPHDMKPGVLRQRQHLAAKLRRRIMIASKQNYKFLATGDETWLYLDNSTGKVWLSPDEEPPSKAAETIGSKKLFMTVFFSGDAILHVSFLPEKTTMNAARFKSTVLKPLLRTMKKQYKPCPPILELYYDNASPHRAKLTQQFIDKSQFVRLEAPPYSPDLSPCDFFLFGYVKWKLSQRRFQSLDELKAGTREILNEIPQTMLHDVFEEWYNRCTWVAQFGRYYPS
jgi:histone-lysine N-methyltransferase SETMAR